MCVSVRDGQEGRLGEIQGSGLEGRFSCQRLLFFWLEVFVLLKTNASKFHLLLLSAHPLPLALGLKSFQVVQRNFSVVVIRTVLTSLRKQPRRPKQ